MDASASQARLVILRVDSPSPHHFVIAIGGQVDLATAPALSVALDGIFAAGARAVAIDASEVTFTDSALLKVMADRPAHQAVRLINPSAAVSRLLAAAVTGSLTEPKVS